MTTKQELGQRDPWRERLKKALPFVNGNGNGNGNSKDCCHAGGGSSGGCHGGLQVDTRGLRKLAILGSPNAGKSALFNRLTGAYVTVSNYPGTTVEVSRGKAKINGEEFEVVDTPGMYSLLPISEEEKVSRDILLQEKPSLVLNVVDAKNLERLLAHDEIFELVLQDDGDLVRILGAQKARKARPGMVGVEADEQVVVARESIGRELAQRLLQYPLQCLIDPGLVWIAVVAHSYPVATTPTAAGSNVRFRPYSSASGPNPERSGGLLLPGALRTPLS